MMKRVFFVVPLLLLSSVLLGQNQREAIRYPVKKGDNLSDIAKNNNVPLDSLYRWNNKSETNSNINIGDQIIIGWDIISSTEKKVKKNDAVSETENTISVIGASSEEEQVQRTAGKSDNKNEKKEEKKKREEKKRKSDGSGFHGQKNEKHFSWGTLLVGLLLGIFLGIVFLYIFFVKKQKAEHERNERDLSQRIAELHGEKTQLNSEVSSLRAKIQSIEREKQQFLDENVVLGEEIDRLKSIGHEADDNRVEKAKAVSPQTSGSSAALYSDAIFDDYFVKVRETPDEDSVFVLQLNGENSASFSVCESARQRVVANPSYLEGCEKQILGNTLQLEIVSKGMAQKDASNGKWKVINKLNVIIR